MGSSYSFYIFVQVQFQLPNLSKEDPEMLPSKFFYLKFGCEANWHPGASLCLFFNALYSPVSAPLSIMGLDVSCPRVITCWAYQSPIGACLMLTFPFDEVKLVKPVFPSDLI